MRRKPLWIALRLGVILTLGFLAIGAVFSSATLHVPKLLTPTPPNAAEVWIQAADQAKLSAWWFPAAKPNGRCVVILHGIGDSRAGGAGFAPMFLDQGYSVLVPDSRAHGASGGEFITYGLLERHDVIGWSDWMKASGCDRRYALGESLGASILIESAAVQPAFAAIVAECPFADLRQIAEYRLNSMSHLPRPFATAVAASGMAYTALFHRLNLWQVSPVHDIAHAATPILLIHGLDDSRTPAWNSELLANANLKNQLWLVPHADHTAASEAAPAEFKSRVLGWFEQH